jgi:putative endonuclease
MQQRHSYFVYILASRIGGTLYVGVTNDIVRRVHEHKLGLANGFAKKHGVHRLVYFEEFGDVRDAIAREKRLKRWNRPWKVRLIEERNPRWVDLHPALAARGDL